MPFWNSGGGDPDLRWVSLLGPTHPPCLPEKTSIRRIGENNTFSDCMLARLVGGGT
jgi:hypothetical protein